MHLEGRTVIITGQDIADIERICDHLGFLIKGKLFYQGPLEDLKAQVKRITVQHPTGPPPLIPPEALRVATEARGRRSSPRPTSRPSCSTPWLGRTGTCRRRR